MPLGALQLVPVRRGGALEEAGELQSFSFPSSVLLHWLWTRNGVPGS